MSYNNYNNYGRQGLWTAVLNGMLSFTCIATCSLQVLLGLHVRIADIGWHGDTPTSVARSAKFDASRFTIIIIASYDVIHDLPGPRDASCWLQCEVGCQC